jgi:hypothetical protein
MAASLSHPPRHSREHFRAMASDKYPPVVQFAVLSGAVLGSWCLFFAALAAAGF